MWKTCESCEEEFSITTRKEWEISYCPLCGEELSVDIDDFDSYDEDDY